MNQTTSLTSRVKRTLPALLGIALGAATFAPANAATIEFETGYGMIYGAGERYVENGYRLDFSTSTGELDGSAVGAIIEGSDPFSCMGMACPTGNPGFYYAALNDSIIWLTKETTNAIFKIKGFDASFIGASTDMSSYPIISGVLRIQGWLADGSTAYQDYILDGPGPGGFDFGRYETTTAFGNLQFVEAAFFGFTCTTTTCTAFNSNRGQFAIDNINLVPEPASGLIVGLGLLGLAAARRRKA